MDLTQSIIERVESIREEGTFGVVYKHRVTHSRSYLVVYFPLWDMFFLYINKRFITMDTSFNLLFDTTDKELLGLV